MYQKHPQGWAKHMDFLLLDLLMVSVSFLLSYALRQGDWNPLQSEPYRGVLILLLPAHFLGALCLNSHKNILRRGYLRELRSVFHISVFDLFAAVLLLFITQSGERFSRLILSGFFLLSVILLYLERIAWKRVLLSGKIRSPYRRNHLLIVTHSQTAASVVRETAENSFGEYEISGLILMDSAASVGEVHGVPVVCAPEEAADYMLNRWVDEVLFCLPGEADIPADLLDCCVEMGITAHVGLDFLAGRAGMRTIEKYLLFYLYLVKSFQENY